jgi:hypothetical protein
MTDEIMLCRLMSASTDFEAVEFLVDRYRWIIEDEVLHCLGMVPFFEDAVATAMVELVRHACKYVPQRQETREWIRMEAARASRGVVRDIERTYVKEGIIQTTPAAGDLGTLVTCLLERRRSPYWDGLSPSRPTCRPGRSLA